MIEMKNIIEESFAQYAGAVAQSRAFVDVRDALKPSNRQINYCLYTDKFLPSKPFKKTLKAIGSIARLYIHGDASAEGIIMRSGQPFAMRYPLVEVEGNGGNLMMSGNWAAPRYTSARLSPFSTMMFGDIEKDTIDEWRDNYDDTEKYPSVLPSKGFYNIVNGTSGIGVGVASSIPQFNLREVNAALEKLLLNPECSFEEIYCVPDFATGGFLINEKEIRDTLKYGSKKEAKKNEADGSSCKLRAKIDYDSNNNCLVVTEIPYGVYTNTICGQLEAIINDEENNPGVDRFNDLTGKSPLIKIYLNKGADAYRITNFLYKNTSLQYHYAINMTMLDNGRFPKVFSWKEALQAHIDHEKDVYRKGYEFDLKKIKSRIHIIDGLLICLAKIDEVVSTIKNASSTAQASIALQTKFLLDEEQAKATLDMKLARLANLEVQKLVDELQKLKEERDEILKILEDKNLFNNELIKTWREVANKYGDDRRTKVITVTAPENDVEIENVKAEDCVVTVTHTGEIKRIPKSSFKVQKKKGKGVKGENEAILATISTNTIDNLLIFTNKGKMYRVLVNDIPVGTNVSKGTSVTSLTNMEMNETIAAVTSLNRRNTSKYVVFITKCGLIKKTELSEYTKVKRSNGIAAINIKEGDEIANVTFIDEEDLVLITKKGMSIHFRTDDITPIGRVAAGVKGIKLNEGDEVVVGLPVRKLTDNIAVFTSKGYSKQTPIEEFSIQGRGGKGIVVYKPADNTGEIIGAEMVNKEDSILLTNAHTSICISAKEIPVSSRQSIGITLTTNSNTVSIVKL